MPESISVSRVSLAVRTLDVWTGRPAASPLLQVRLAGDVRRRPLRSSDGTWIFMDVTSETCVVSVVSDVYLPCEREVNLASLPAGNPVIDIYLLPGRRYSAPPAATGLMRRLTDEKGGALAGVKVNAYADDERCARGRLLDEEVLPGSAELRPLPSGPALMNGDLLAIRSKENPEAEWFRVQPCELDAKPCLRLDRPLAGRWKRHALLLPGAETISDADGWIVLPFRGRMLGAGKLRVCLRNGKETVEAEWPMEEGKVLSLPPFLWPSNKSEK
ncbi:hypothetical protein [Paenibacillus sp. PL2-23]|uniref:hypothetical protein n=1 Tax=Paenibacillus sp. PL2-23 TaxID=2100729 RepID=UPI0030F99D6B